MKKLIGALLAIVVLILGVGFFLPSDVIVARTIEIDAPRRIVHALITDTNTWPQWTVWNSEMDPTLKVTPVNGGVGVGAGYTWEGDTMGQGEVRIDSADPATGVRITTTFDHGKFTSGGGFRYEGDGKPTVVTWEYTASMGANPIGRWYGLFMDGQLGPDLEGGLLRLEARAEEEAAKPANRIIDAVDQAGKDIGKALEDAGNTMMDAAKEALKQGTGTQNSTGGN